ncbi:Qat anti-phage system associated protein QatB [Salinisphaera sp. LB1]|uniref:Qat anti-phage system associated protein QatB n=1 Tax=Salinisphaera sp. LB1 TaxID=2183911 RepID=UPI000FEEAF72
MGTSGTFGGSKNGLVPSWVDEPASPPAVAPDSAEPDSADGDGIGGPDQNGETPLAQPGATPAQSYPPIPRIPASSRLGGARGNMTRGARTSDERALRRGAGRYVRASGGGRSTASRMPNSRAMAGGVAGLARSFANQGPAEALRRFNLEGMAGAPAEDVFVALTDMLCPAGGTIDEAIARDAMLETVADLAASGVGNFDELSADNLREFFIGVVSRSIEGKILNEVGTNAIAAPSDVAGVERAQAMLHDFIEGCVRDEFDARETDLSDLDAAVVDSFVDDLYGAALDLVKALGDDG